MDAAVLIVRRLELKAGEMRGNDRKRAAQSRVACAEVKLMKEKGEELR